MQGMYLPVAEEVTSQVVLAVLADIRSYEGNTQAFEDVGGSSSSSLSQRPRAGLRAGSGLKSGS